MVHYAADPEPTDSKPAEPLLSVGLFTTFVIAAIALLISFGVPLSDKQQSAILALVAAAAPLVTALIGRLRVYSPRTVARLLDEARRRPPNRPTT